MATPHVLRVNCCEEETAFRLAVSEVIRLIISERNVTLIDIAERIDVSVKTISNAFNKTHSLSQTFLNRLGTAFGPHALDPVARLYGGRHVPLTPDHEADALPSTTAAIHKLALARSPDSPGGERITHGELLGMEHAIDAAIRALSALKVRCEQARAA